MLARDRFDTETLNEIDPGEKSSSPSSSHHDLTDDEQDIIEELESRSRKSKGFLSRYGKSRTKDEGIVSKGIPIKCVLDTDDDDDDDDDDRSDGNSNVGGKDILFNFEDSNDNNEVGSDDNSDDNSCEGEKEEIIRREIVFDISRDIPAIDENLSFRNKQSLNRKNRKRTSLGCDDDDDDDDETGIRQAKLFATAMSNESKKQFNRRDLMRKDSSFSLRQIMSRVNSFRNNDNETMVKANARASSFGKRGPPRQTTLSQSFRNISLGSTDSIDSLEENYNSNIWLVDYAAEIKKGGPKQSRISLLRNKPLQASICLIVALSLIAVFAFTASKSQHSSSAPKDTNMPTAIAISRDDRFNETVSFLTETTSISSLQNLNDPTSPQFRAADWLVDEDRERFPIPISGKNSIETGVVNVYNNQISPFDFIQRYVLLVLYFALGGDDADNSWTNQYHFASPGQSECSWHDHTTGGGENDDDADLDSKVVVEDNDNAYNFIIGVVCDRELQVRHISLPNNNLKGSIPSEIQYLSNLESLDLKGNFLVGSIPENLQNLVQLTHLDLSNNNLSGQANPLDWLGHNMIRLEILNLSNNQLNLFDQDSKFSRREPIGGENKLKILRFGGNLPDEVVGDDLSTYSIPDGIRHLTNLQQLSLHNSNIGGRIPAWLFHELSELQFVDLSHNQLTGSITDIFPAPGGLSPLQHLKALLLHDNKLTGTLPESIGMLSDLGTVTIHHTNMTVGINTANLICLSGEGILALESLSTDCDDSTCLCCLEICCDGEDCHRDVDWNSGSFSNSHGSEGSDHENRS